MKATAKVAAVATGLAMATSMLSLAPMAHAQTTTTTTTTTTCSVGTTDLHVGSSGAAVTCLQQTLIAQGFSIPAGATGYFGAQTKSAVAAWQAKVGVAPAAGYFGAISRSHWTGAVAVSTVPGCMPGAAFSSTTGAACTTTTTSTPGCVAGAAFSTTTGQACSTTTTTTLSGSGRLTSISSLGDVTSDIKEGDSATQVVGVTADATGGDVAIQRVDATFTVANVGTQSANLDKYVSDVSLYLNGTKLASMDPASGDKNGRVWTIRFAGLNGVVKSGQTANLYVKVTPVSSVGINETGKSVTASLLADSVRAVGADGISETYVTSAINQTFTVSTMTTGTLTVSEAGDNPVASQVAVSSSTTSGVTLLSFNAKAKNQDVVITDLVVSASTSDNNLNDVVSTLKLMKGSTVLSSKTVSSGSNGTVTFTNIDQTITKDSTVNFTVVADLKGDSSYPDNTTLSASTTVSGWDVSDTGGATVTPSSAVAGKTMTLTAAGLTVTRGTPTATVNSANYSNGVDTASFTIPFTVTAGDSDIFVAGAVQKSTASVASKVTYSTTTTSTSGATGEPVASLSASGTVTGDSTTGLFYKVLAGTSRTFTFNAAITATSTGATTSGFVGVQLNSIAYGTSSGALTSFYTSNLDTFKTNDVFVQKH